MGAALIPNKQIYRKNKDKEFYIYFSEDTVRKASELFLMRSNQNNATYEHERKMLEGMSVVESWIIEDEKTDKSRLYGFSLPKGTWMISMKVNNDEVWQKVKDGEVKGFSIEGYFVDKYDMSKNINEMDTIEKLKELIRKHDNETKLGAHIIELGIADKANKSFDTFRDGIFQKTSDLQDNLLIQIKDYNKKVEAAYKKFREIEKGEYLDAYTKITEMARELGIAPAQVPDLEGLQKKYNFNNTVFERIKPIKISQ